MWSLIYVACDVANYSQLSYFVGVANGFETSKSCNYRGLKTLSRPFAPLRMA